MSQIFLPSCTLVLNIQDMYLQKEMHNFQDWLQTPVCIIMCARLPTILHHIPHWKAQATMATTSHDSMSSSQSTLAALGFPSLAKCSWEPEDKGAWIAGGCHGRVQMNQTGVPHAHPPQMEATSAASTEGALHECERLPWVAFHPHGNLHLSRWGLKKRSVHDILYARAFIVP